MSGIPREPNKRGVVAQAVHDHLLRESLVDKDAIWSHIYGRVTAFLFLFAALATLAVVLIWPQLSEGMEGDVNSSVFGQWARVKNRDSLLLLLVFFLIVHAVAAEAENQSTHRENKKLRQDLRALAERVGVLEQQAGIKETSPVLPPIRQSPN